jgi:hypothetical protein
VSGLSERLRRFLGEVPNEAAMAELAELRRDVDQLRTELVALIEQVRAQLFQATATMEATIVAETDRHTTATAIMEASVTAAIERHAAARVSAAELELVDRLTRIDDHLRRLKDAD